MKIDHYHHLGAEELKILLQYEGQFNKILEGIDTVMNNSEQLHTDIQDLVSGLGDLKTTIEAEFAAFKTKVANGDTIAPGDLTALEGAIGGMKSFHLQAQTAASAVMPSADQSASSGAIRDAGATKSAESAASATGAVAETKQPPVNP